MHNRKLKNILLIDDNSTSNFLHQIILKELECAEHIEVSTSAQKALDYLSNIKSAESMPELIFLDLNMPGMNGWEFLEEYKKLAPDNLGKVVMNILTSSANPKDKEKAEKDLKPMAYFTKPLNKEKMLTLLEREFNWKPQ